ncbi:MULTISPECIES: amino acid adenylation domain-containing protein [unclassified Streptomyces]|uniref:non-ribosomal peptide synthetase n=1 Tax=unclassified Streptomyces TaxID=2593676 RepID=UPI00382C76B0
MIPAAAAVWEPIHQRFEHWAETDPDRIAVVDTGRRTTYGELNRTANALARGLRTLGARPGTLVGVTAARTTPGLAAIIAVLKCGAGYVPLDPQYPRRRLDHVIADCALPFVVGEEEHRPLLEGTGVRFAATETLTALATGTDGNGDTGARPDDCAYVIHTSGSTGRPKGVVVPHRNLPQLFDGARPLLGFGPGDVWAAFHSFSFDFSVWEIWGALAHGGTLLLVPPLTARDPEALWDLLRAQHVTVLCQTPTAFRSLVNRAVQTGHPPTGLRLVVFGGEELRPAALAPWYRGYGDTGPRLVNMYGITETTVHVTARPLNPDDTARDDSPIGVPLPGVTVHLLDSTLTPVPQGAEGELCVSGFGVADGYLRRPELTEARFVPVPDGPTGARMYRSGDLARWDGDELIYLGRLDRQIQLRGFRIEPGEVEAALSTLPGVDRAFVTVRPDDGGEDALVAYALPTPHSRPEPGGLRAALAGLLPAHEVPRAVVLVSSLPLTVQGKADIEALPDPWSGPSTVMEPLQEPNPGPPSSELARTPEARTLARAWRKVLGVSRVRPEDDFFALGGDSLHAVRVVAAARADGLGLSVSQLYEHPRLTDLAHALTTTLPPAPPAETTPTTDVHPISAAQAGILYDCEVSTDPGLYRVLACLTLKGTFDRTALTAALSEVSARHEVLRSHFALSSSGAVQRISPDPTVPLQVHDPVPAPVDGTVCETRWRRDWARRISPYRPPLAHCHVLPHTHGDTWELALVVHHAILDGWSLALVLDELLHRYTAHVKRRPTPPAQPLPGSWHHLDLEHAALADPADRGFWDGQLTGAATSHLLAPAAASERAASRTSGFTLDPAQTDTLRDLARDLSVPVKAVFVAAQLRATAELSDTDQATVGLAFHHRPETETGAEAVGMFLGVLPLTAPVLPGTTWKQLITDAFEAERTVMRHRWTPLAELARRQNTPLFHTVVNYTDFRPLRPLRTGNLRQIGDWLLRNPTAFPLYTEIQRHATDGHCTVDVTSPSLGTAAHATAARLHQALGEITALRSP